MTEQESRSIKELQEVWNKEADSYDNWLTAFKGHVGQRADLALLKKFLPESRNAAILDAAGGTGRLTVPLAQMGYSVTLCDVSPGMLDVARRKVVTGEIADNVSILVCDVRNLPFADEVFDFTLCWDVPPAIAELIRVTKKGGSVSIGSSGGSRWASAIEKFGEDPDSALALTESGPPSIEDDWGQRCFVTPEELTEFFEARGVTVLDIHASYRWLHQLGIPEEVQDSHEWDETLADKIIEMVVKLRQEPSLRGMAKHFIVYGRKR